MKKTDMIELKTSLARSLETMVTFIGPIPKDHIEQIRNDFMTMLIDKDLMREKFQNVDPDHTHRLITCNFDEVNDYIREQLQYMSLATDKAQHRYLIAKIISGLGAYLKSLDINLLPAEDLKTTGHQLATRLGQSRAKHTHTCQTGTKTDDLTDYCRANNDKLSAFLTDLVEVVKKHSL